jgi:hypothetical protein
MLIRAVADDEGDPGFGMGWSEGALERQPCDRDDVRKSHAPLLKDNNHASAALSQLSIAWIAPLRWLQKLLARDDWGFEYRQMASSV